MEHHEILGDDQWLNMGNSSYNLNSFLMLPVRRMDLVKSFQKKKGKKERHPSSGGII